MHIGVDSYEQSIKICGRCIENPWALLQVYDHTWAARQQAAALATAEWHRRLASDIFTQIPERLIKIRNLPHGGHLSVDGLAIISGAAGAAGCQSG
jgi:hypothetical protein